MAPSEVHVFMCKLRLLRQGLVKEAADLENIHEKVKMTVANESSGGGDSSSEDASGDESDRLRKQRDEFVRKALKRARKEQRLDLALTEKHEAVTTERRSVIKQFLERITKVKECGSCQG